MGFIQHVENTKGIGTRFLRRVFFWALRRYRQRLEAEMRPEFDRRLSLKLDAIEVLLEG